MGWAQPIFFSGPDSELRETVRLGEFLETTLPPLGFELVDWEMSPRAGLVRVFIDKPARRGRRGLRAGEQPPDAAVRRREHRLRASRGELAGARPAAQEARRLRPLRRRGSAADAARADRRRAALEGHRCGGRRRRRGRRWKPRRARARSPSRRSTARLVPKIEWRKANEPRTAAAGGCARAREERAEGHRLRRARVRARVGDQEALPERGDRRARGDRPRDRRLRLVPPLDRRARRGARGARAPDRDHRRRRARSRASSSATSSRSRSSRSSSAASARRPRSR